MKIDLVESECCRNSCLPLREVDCHNPPLEVGPEMGPDLGSLMARTRNKLTARAVSGLSRPCKHSDGGGLYLRIDDDDVSIRRRWIFRFVMRGRTRETGLGGYPEVSLADARKARDAAEKFVQSGQDPIAARDDGRRAQIGKPTFGQVADALIEARSRNGATTSSAHSGR
jgi:Arm DNA-binding domain